MTCLLVNPGDAASLCAGGLRRVSLLRTFSKRRRSGGRLVVSVPTKTSVTDKMDKLTLLYPTSVASFKALISYSLKMEMMVAL